MRRTNSTRSASGLLCKTRRTDRHKTVQLNKSAIGMNKMNQAKQMLRAALTRQTRLVGAFSLSRATESLAQTCYAIDATPDSALQNNITSRRKQQSGLTARPHVISRFRRLLSPIGSSCGHRADTRTSAAQT